MSIFLTLVRIQHIITPGVMYIRMPIYGSIIRPMDSRSDSPECSKFTWRSSLPENRRAIERRVNRSERIIILFFYGARIIPISFSFHDWEEVVPAELSLCPTNDSARVTYSKSTYRILTTVYIWLIFEQNVPTRENIKCARAKKFNFSFHTLISLWVIIVTTWIVLKFKIHIFLDLK